jgi:hypothetical protein
MSIYSAPLVYPIQLFFILTKKEYDALNDDDIVVTIFYNEERCETISYGESKRRIQLFTIFDDGTNKQHKYTDLLKLNKNVPLEGKVICPMYIDTFEILNSMDTLYMGRDTSNILDDGTEKTSISKDISWQINITTKVAIPYVKIIILMASPYYMMKHQEHKDLKPGKHIFPIANNLDSRPVSGISVDDPPVSRISQVDDR